MKNKLTINTLAKSNLKMRKKRYAVMIIGILLAMVFSSGILFFVSSIISTNTENAKKAYGLQDGFITNVTEDDIKGMKDKGIVSDYGFAHIIGLATYGDENKEIALETPGLFVGYYDDKTMDMSYISFIEGRYPQNKNEIALEKNAMLKLGIKANVGDTVTLNLFPQSGDSYAKKPVEKTYKLVGIANNKQRYLTQGIGDDKEVQIPAIFVSQGTQTEIGGKEILTAYMMYSDGVEGLYEKVFKYCNENGIRFDDGYHFCSYDNYIAQIRVNNEYTESHGIIVLGVILACVLLLVSCLGVVNAFSSNLNERKKQIGMFRTVGATRRQIISIYGREAIIITLLCVPLSVAISYFLTKLIVHLINENFVLVPNFKVLALSAVLSVIFVMIAAFIPLVKASRISPIQSIRNIEITRKMKRKKIKTQKEFNMPSLLAKRNLSFYNKSQVSVCIILILTILLSSYSFSILPTTELGWIDPWDYSIQGFYGRDGINIKKDYKLTNEDKQRLLELPYFKEINGTKSCCVNVLFDEYTDYLRIIDGNFNLTEKQLKKAINENAGEILFSEFHDYRNIFKSDYNINREYISITISSNEENMIKKLEKSVLDGKINYDKLNSGEEIILVAPKNIGFEITFYDDGNGYSYGVSSGKDIDEEKCILTAERKLKVGDKIDLSIILGDEFIGDEHIPNNWEKNNKTVTIGAIIEDIPRMTSIEGNYNTQNGIGLITTNIGMEHFCKELNYNMLNADLAVECTDGIDREIMSVINEIAVKDPDAYIYSQYAQSKKNEQTQMNLKVALISVVILLLSVSGSIINNSLTAQIRDGKRKIGTLRAVGASISELTQSYIRQLLSVFGVSYITGFALFGISYAVMCIVMKIKEKPIPFTPILWQTALACLVLFVICSINLWAKIRKEMKNSIIDNIREL